MSISAKKRIMKEIGMMQNPEQKKILNDSGIYYKFDDENFHHVKVMMMGPKDTPYSSGYYFYDINFPPRYPIDPPKVKFISLSRIRMNPNMYVCGKLCLSMINTWSGPSWTACMSLSQVLVATQSLLNENPIQNEPGFENEKGARSSSYNKVVSYANLKHHIVGCLLKIPQNYECFKDIIVDNFIKNYEDINTYINKNLEFNNVSQHSQVYGLNILYNFDEIQQNLNKIQLMYGLGDLAETQETKSPELCGQVTTASAPILPKKKPSAIANNFEVGYKMTSEHDNRVYEVKLCKGEKRIFKRWIVSK